ncbi:MAG: universal stress protein [Desulfobulbaceae bacterium]|nr:universal stress protein [Desulfobulbaceae bacterium]
MKEIKKIMVPVDFSTHTEKLVEYALTLAEAFSADVELVHVVESFIGYDMLLVHPSFEQITLDLQEKAKEKMNKLVSEQVVFNGKVTGKVVVGDVVDEILEYADTCDADLMVVGTHGTKGLEKVLMGSVAARISKKAPCPVLIVNPIQYLLKKWHKIEDNV